MKHIGPPSTMFRGGMEDISSSNHRIDDTKAAVVVAVCWVVIFYSARATVAIQSTAGTSLDLIIEEQHYYYWMQYEYGSIDNTTINQSKREGMSCQIICFPIQYVYVYAFSPRCLTILPVHCHHIHNRPDGVKNHMNMLDMFCKNIPRQSTRVIFACGPPSSALPSSSIVSFSIGFGKFPRLQSPRTNVNNLESAYCSLYPERSIPHS